MVVAFRCGHLSGRSVVPRLPTLHICMVNFSKTFKQTRRIHCQSAPFRSAGSVLNYSALFRPLEIKNEQLLDYRLI